MWEICLIRLNKSEALFFREYFNSREGDGERQTERDGETERDGGRDKDGDGKRYGERRGRAWERQEERPIDRDRQVEGQTEMRYTHSNNLMNTQYAAYDNEIL